MPSRNSDSTFISSDMTPSHGPIFASPNHENGGVVHIIGVIAAPEQIPGHAVTRA